MKENEKKMELLGNAPVPRALLALGLPTMVGMMINALYNLVDAYFVGGLGTSQMGAITVAFPLGQVVVGLGLLFGNGAASCLSRLLGQGGPGKMANRGGRHRPVQQHFCGSAGHFFLCDLAGADSWAAGGERQRDAVRAQLHGNLYRLLHF